MPTQLVHGLPCMGFRSVRTFARSVTGIKKNIWLQIRVGSALIREHLLMMDVGITYCSSPQQQNIFDRLRLQLSWIAPLAFFFLQERSPKKQQHAKITFLRYSPAYRQVDQPMASNHSSSNVMMSSICSSTIITCLTYLPTTL